MLYTFFLQIRLNFFFAFNTLFETHNQTTQVFLANYKLNPQYLIKKE
jgi:hypothetical protein